MENNLLMNGKIVYPNKLKIKKSIKVAIIGSGKMANDYSEVVTSFGHKIKIFISKSHSKNSIILSKKYKSLLSSHISDIKSVNIDLIIICSKWSDLYPDLLEALKFKKPILLEKSIILSSPRFKKILKHNVFMAKKNKNLDH